jgi:biopolymer transport protein ExbD
MQEKKPNPDASKDMKRAYPVMKRNQKSRGQDSEVMDIDVSSYLNVFLALLPMLITMAVFTQIAVIDFSLPPAAEPGAAAQNPQDMKDLDISIVVTPAGFRIVGTGKQLDLVPTERGTYQFEKLRAFLKAIKFQYPSQKSVILVLDGEILYDDIVKFMDVCRECQFPDIALSGEIG